MTLEQLERAAFVEREVLRPRGARTPEQIRADEVVDEMLRLGIERTRALSEREKRALDELWIRLEAEAAFVAPGRQELERLRAAAAEIITREVDHELGEALLMSFATSLGLPVRCVGIAVALARRQL